MNVILFFLKIFYFPFLVKYSAKVDQQVIIEDTTTTFTLGEVEDPKIVLGLETAIKKMKSQERSRIVLSPAFAFGKDGNQELNVPPNVSVTYEVELISFEKVTKFWIYSVLT